MSGTGIETPFPVSGRPTLEISGSFELTLSVPLPVPVDDGLNLTETVQLLPEESVFGTLPHGLDPPLSSRLKSAVPDNVIPVTSRSAEPALTTVTSRPVDELPTVILPKSWLAGATKMSGTGTETPLPVSETFTLGVSVSSDSIASVPVFVPVDDGLNPTETVQLLPDVSVFDTLPHGLDPPLSSSVKFVVSDNVIPVMFRSPVPVLDIAISKSDDEPPAVTLPKS